MAIKVFKKTSRIPVKIGDAVFKLAPMDQEQKTELMQYISLDGGNRIENLAKISFLSCKYTIKEIEGLVYEDGSPFELSFDEKGVSDKSLSELMNTEISQELLSACQAFLQGIPKEILDPQTKKKFKNVEILSESASKKNS